MSCCVRTESMVDVPCDGDPRTAEFRRELSRARDDRAGARSLLVFGGLFAATFALKAHVSEDPAWFWIMLKLFGVYFFWSIFALHGDAQRRIRALRMPPPARATRVARAPS